MLIKETSILMSAPQIEHNNHEAIRFYVTLSFVNPDHQSGYQIEDFSHAETKEQAIVDVLKRHMDEAVPLSGIAVYQLVFTC